MYVTDTHAFLWYLSEDKRLSKKALEAFEECDTGKDIMIIPSIVLVEALFLCEDERVELKFEEIISRLQISSNYHVYPLDERVVAECMNIKLSDPHDRIIVATAKLLNAKLITKDENIRKTKIVKTIW
jgi:PIN domain nuclease of toxin-antitoxin system